MPELPEVEVTRRSLRPVLVGERIESVTVRERRFRLPVPTRKLRSRLVGRRIERLRRRSKYLLIDVEGGNTLIIHLGMSGRLRWLERAAPEEPHEHVVFACDSGSGLRFRDPRRFGLVLVERTQSLFEHELFRHLGPEPLEADAGAVFDDDYLLRTAKGRTAPIKSFLMDARVVVGVGNIYACEALFRAGIHPKRAAGRIGAERMQLLTQCVRDVLEEAIAQGGTTLNDFADASGEPGYFVVELLAYGREGEPCQRCGREIRRIVQSNRSTFYCPACQR